MNKVQLDFMFNNILYLSLLSLELYNKFLFVLIDKCADWMLIGELGWHIFNQKVCITWKIYNIPYKWYLQRKKIILSVQCNMKFW